jgi:hypothetical protein
MKPTNDLRTINVRQPTYNALTELYNRKFDRSFDTIFRLIKSANLIEEADTE